MTVTVTVNVTVTAAAAVTMLGLTDCRAPIIHSPPESDKHFPGGGIFA
jgi:hypothetical protein